MDSNNPIICVTGNEPIPTFNTVVARPKVVLIGASSGLSKQLTDAMLAEVIAIRHNDDWLGPDPCESEEYSSLSDCKQDHGERTNYKLKDQPFYMRGRNGKMRGY